MSRSVTRSLVVRRPCAEVSAFISDPHQVLEAIPGFARFRYVADGPGPGEEEWDVFLDIGTLHIGGRVIIAPSTERRLAWTSDRGTRHTFTMTAEPEGAHTRLTMTMTYEFAGLVLARVTEMLARGIAARHLEAGLQEIRHLLEYGDAVSVD